VPPQWSLHDIAELEQLQATLVRDIKHGLVLCDGATINVLRLEETILRN